MAGATGICSKTVCQILDFHRNGNRPDWTRKKTKRSSQPKNETPKYVKIAADVRLVSEKRSFPGIAKWLRENRGISVHTATIQRAWDYARRTGNVRTGEGAGARRYCHIPADVYAKIREELSAGHSASGIAKSVRCSLSTVHRVRRALRDSRTANDC